MSAIEDDRRNVRRRKGEPAKGQEHFQEVLVALRRIIRATDLHSKQLSKNFGLTTPQVYVLQAIRDLGDVTTGQLSGRVNLSQGTVTTILDRLESRGLIERYRSLADRRVVHARLTTQGRRVLKKAPPLLQERFRAAFASLGPTDQDRIVKTLKEVAHMMGAGELDAAPVLAVGSPAADENAFDVRERRTDRKSPAEGPKAAANRARPAPGRAGRRPPPRGSDGGITSAT